MQKRFLFLLAAFLFHTAHAQYEEKDFIRYTVQDGLNDNYITCLQQDNQGYIWAGSDIGLCRFDGSHFKHFNLLPTGSQLINGTIKKIKKWGANQLGIIGRNGFQVLNTADFTVQNYQIADSTAFKVQLNDDWDAISFPDKSIGISSASGFYVYDASGKITFRHDAYFLQDIGKQRIFYGRDIFSINQHECLVYYEEKGLAYYNNFKKIFRNITATDNNFKAFCHPIAAYEKWVTKFQLNNNEFIFINFRKDSLLFYNRLLDKIVTSPLGFKTSMHISWETKIEMLNDTAFVMNDGTSGFYLFNINRHSGKISGGDKKFLPNNKIICLYVDKDKRLWVGTDAGLLQQRLSEPYLTAFQYKPLQSDSVTGHFTCIFSFNNKLYAGRNSLRKGMLIIDAQTMQIKKQIDIFGTNNSWNEILSIQMYHPDTLWLGTNAGLLWLDTKTDHYGKLSDRKDFAWTKDFVGMLAPVNSDGYAWMCSFLDGKVVRYHIASRTYKLFTAQTQPALPFNKVKSIAYDSYGDVWIGGHSLTRWTNSKQTFDTLITVYGGANKYNDDILMLTADNNGSLWMHNAFNGLLEYKIKEKKFIPYTMKDGFPTDVLACLSPIIEHTLWVGSNSHLSAFDTRTKNIVVYDQQDGLPEHKPSGRKIYFEAQKSLLYMLSGEYIVKIPSNRPPIIDNSSNLLLQEIIVNNKNFLLQPNAELNFRYNENNLTLNFTVIDFEKSNYQFAYKINEAGNWISLGPQRSLNLSNLQPGKYLIQLKAIGKSGMEKLTNVNIIVEPPFWKSMWFVITCAVLLIGSLYYLYRRRIKQIRQKANIDKLLAETEMKALHSQMNPHFIFNSLNSIREMILNNENRNASHYLSKFASLIRITLNQSGQSLISLRNTIEYLERYVEMEKIRNHEFTCTIQFSDELDLDETVLPPMLLQPFIENAIWHGITSQHKDINITVNFNKQQNQLICTIEDNGIGINQSMENKKGSVLQSLEKDSMHHSMGIANIKNRIDLLNEKYGLRTSFTIQDKNDLNKTNETGTIVTLQLPLEINEP